MAQLRLMAVVLAACNASDAAPPPVAPPDPPIATVPDGWVPLPALELAARGVTGTPTDAWGEPAMGCYATSLTLPERGKVGALLDDVKKSVTVSDAVVPSAAGGVLSFAFAKGEYKGRVRANLDGKNVTALACFWNQREPAACEAACTAMIGSMK
jgi:hypothetical protein